MKNLVLTSILSAAMITAVSGQTIPQREANQQERIGAGVKDGSLTSGEAVKLEREESHLNQNLSQERANAERRENGPSRNIYQDRHNGNTTNPNSAMSQRVGNGIQDGSLTPKEAAKVEGERAAIHRQASNDRAANGGTLTPGEKHQVGRENRAVSRQITRMRHK
ncbi:MAG: hypothetical protein K2X03_16135 [Bryobacteraceae bacterium]|nr:hypothetical protein [Bryobacteraceae bacterium]